MRCARVLLLVRMLAASTVLWLPPAGAAVAANPAGPQFAGYPTDHRGAPPAFDFARLDGPPAPDVVRVAAATAGLPPLAQLAAVNARVNRVPWRDDLDAYGVDDHWATPQEFFRNGGDCEDYAIAKYAVLERLGWPPDRMWITVLRETVISLPHAVLLVERDHQLWTLDNLSDPVFRHGAIDYYRPAYSVNRFGSWSHRAVAVAHDGADRRGPGGR